MSRAEGAKLILRDRDSHEEKCLLEGEVTVELALHGQRMRLVFMPSDDVVFGLYMNPDRALSEAEKLLWAVCFANVMSSLTGIEELCLRRRDDVELAVLAAHLSSERFDIEQAQLRKLGSEFLE